MTPEEIAEIQYENWLEYQARKWEAEHDIRAEHDADREETDEEVQRCRHEL